MKKAENVKEFVERIDATKKVNPKDLSSDQDLTIAIMNLISIEEHLVFSGAKTGKTSFYDLIEDVRETRKKLMMKIIPVVRGRSLVYLQTPAGLIHAADGSRHQAAEPRQQRTGVRPV